MRGAHLMRRGVALLLCGLGVSAATLPQEKRSYDVSLIRPGLRTDAPAVFRERSLIFEVSDSREAVATVTRACTIFGKDGRDHGTLELPYDQFRKIEDLKGALYDAQGSLIRKLEGDDITDHSYVDDASLYQDARVRAAELYYDRYPYTVEYSYRVVYDGYLSWPSWSAQPTDVPVEHSRFEVVLPALWQLRYTVVPDSALPKISTGALNTYVWEATNLPQLSPEDLEEDVECRTTVVHIAPRQFEIGDTRGDLSGWSSFGRWAAGLYTGKSALPEDAVKEVLATVRNATSQREKVDLLYSYMKARTRYVSVQLGLGGWEPFDATFVHQKGYGDCKALVNYMISLLHVAGITAYPALVYGGGDHSPVIESFPDQVFNHVLACVPLGKDSVWLECTSQTCPPGYLGAFTEGRLALLLTPAGGTLVRTPASVAEENLCARRGRVSLYGGGSGSAELDLTLTGNYADEARDALINTSPADQSRWLAGTIQVSGATLGTHAVEGLQSQAKTIAVRMQLQLPALGSGTEKRVFFQPNLTDRKSTPPQARKLRRSPVRIPFPRLCTDSIRYVLPGGFKVEAIPSPVTLATSFGSFSSSVSVLGDTVMLYRRNLILHQSQIPASHYHEYVEFFNQVTRADKAQVVLVRE